MFTLFIHLGVFIQCFVLWQFENFPLKHLLHLSSFRSVDYLFVSIPFSIRISRKYVLLYRIV